MSCRGGVLRLRICEHSKTRLELVATAKFMGHQTESHSKTYVFSSFANRGGSVVWCFVPVGEQRVGSCSSGFLEYFGLPEDLSAAIAFSDPRLLRGLEAKGFSIESLSGEEARPSQRSNVCGASDVNFLSEVVLDAAGLPAGRMLIFEENLMVSLPAQTIKRLKDAQEKLQVLSAREAEILDLVYNGLTNKAIGIKSGISEKTVEKHRSNIMNKLGVRNSSHLIRCVNDARLAKELVGGE